MSKGKKIALGVFLVFVLAVAVVGGWAFGVWRHAVTENGGKSVSIMTAWKDLHEVAFDPRAGFPNQHKLEILCMGIDDSWTTKDEVYTSDSRTDTLFLMTLNLDNGTATMLSIPRDSYVPIAGTKYSDKINSAYSTGGPDRTVATVAELTGVHASKYVVLNINATKELVNALGGVNLTVEHPMKYTDNWGHLHINLQPGFQHLDGDQAVGFARYRHPDAGMPPTPEDGDVRRMYRQHVLMQAMVAKAKEFSNLAQVNNLVNIAMSNIRTNMTREQLFDLASLYKSIQPASIQGASLPGKSFRGPGGAWDYQLDPQATKAYVAWYANGDPTLMNHMTTVIVKNGTSVPGLAEGLVRKLRAEGYTNVYNGGNAPAPSLRLTSESAAQSLPQTTILDTGVPNKETASTLAQDLNVSAAITRKKVQPNHLGWTPPATLTISLGEDYASLIRDGAPPVTVGPAASSQIPVRV